MYYFYTRVELNEEGKLKIFVILLNIIGFVVKIMLNWLKY